MKITHSQFETLGSAEGILGFSTVDGAGVMRTLTVQGRPMYRLGIGCGSCAFLFERIDQPHGILPPEILRRRLAAGLQDLDQEVVKAFAGLLPADDYAISLTSTKPEFVYPLSPSDYFANEHRALFGFEPPFYDLPADPLTPYYRVGREDFAPTHPHFMHAPTNPPPRRAAIFGFLAPMESFSALDPQTVAEFEEDDAIVPTAVTLSVLDVKMPSASIGADDSSDLDAHWCWTHFLIDGHHKAKAAANQGRELQVLSFTALSGGASARSDVEELLEVLGE